MLIKTLLLVTGFVTIALALHRLRAADDDSQRRFETVRERIAPHLKGQLSERGLRLGAPIFIRIFKEEMELELWVQSPEGPSYELFKTYTIARFSGELGPKLREGDRQAPEGFYFVSRSGMNPRSRFHLSFDLGYPNAFDRHHSRTGSHLMVHGSNVSIGCYAMTDARIEEIYTLADAALGGGQRFFRVHCFPFRMTGKRMARARTHRWAGFWENLRKGYDRFEEARIPPDCSVNSAGRYTFSAAPE